MCRYNPDLELPTTYVGPRGYRGDMFVPEFKTKTNSMINPFPINVYRAENVIPISFMGVRSLIHFRIRNP